MDFTEKLRLRGQAEEDRYFAELDQQLIKAMHEHQQQENDLQKSPHPDESGLPPEIPNSPHGHER